MSPGDSPSKADSPATSPENSSRKKLQHEADKAKFKANVNNARIRRSSLQKQQEGQSSNAGPPMKTPIHEYAHYTDNYFLTEDNEKIKKQQSIRRQSQEGQQKPAPVTPQDKAKTAMTKIDDGNENEDEDENETWSAEKLVGKKPGAADYKKRGAERQVRIETPKNRVVSCYGILENVSMNEYKESSSPATQEEREEEREN